MLWILRNLSYPIFAYKFYFVFNTAQSLFSGQRMEKQELSSQINFLCYFQSTNLKTRLLATHVWSYWQSAVHSIFYKKKHKLHHFRTIPSPPFKIQFFWISFLIFTLHLHPHQFNCLLHPLSFFLLVGPWPHFIKFLLVSTEFLASGPLIGWFSCNSLFVFSILGTVVCPVISFLWWM